MPVIVFAALLAGAPNPYLDEARRAVDALKFSVALEKLALAEKVPTLDNVQRRDIKLLEARCHIAQGDRAKAEQAFEALVKVEPGFSLDESESPKIRDLFLSTKLRLFPRGFVGLETSVVSGTLTRVRLVDPWHLVRSVVLFSRSSLEASFEENPLPLEGNEAKVQAAQWFAEARGEDGKVLATYGTREAPIGTLAAAARVAAVVTAPAPQGRQGSYVPSIVTFAAAVAAAGAATTLQLLSQQQQSLGMANGSAAVAMQFHNQAVREAWASVGCFIGAGVAGAAGVVLVIALP